LRHILTYILLSLAIFQGCVSLLLPLVQLSRARNRASSRLRSKEGEEIFILKKVDFANGRSGSREWWHEGQLYDLKKVEPLGDLVRLHAVADAQEQWIIAGFQRIFGAAPHTRSPSNPLTRLLVQILAQPFLPAEHAWTLESPLALCFFHQGSHSFQTQNLLGFAQVFSPPPEFT